MRPVQRTISLLLVVILIAILGVALTAGGAWLVALGGSWYYLLAGITLLVTAVLLYRRNPAGLWVYAALFLATFIWSLWEAGLDWWPIATRCGVLFLLGVLLLIPPVVRPLMYRYPGEVSDRADSSDTIRVTYRARTPLAGSLALFFVVALVTIFMDPHSSDGTLEGSAVQAVNQGSEDVPDGEWHAYGRTGFGQRYSPLDQITPDNVGSLEVAWHYKTGDVRAESDPEETTFQVTPLKIGQNLYLCTPHQSVIALNATTGKEIWRYDPEIQGGLALQHLTCRGLSYFPGAPGVTSTDRDEDVPTEAEAATSTDTGAGIATEPGEDTPAADETGSTPAGSAQPVTNSASGVFLRAASAQSSAASDDASSPVEAANQSDSDSAGLAEKAQYTEQPVAAEIGPSSDACQAMLFMPTADGRIIALNPEDGAVCADFGNGTGQIDLWANMPNWKPGGYYSTSPVVVTESLVIVGGTVLDNVSTEETSGVIRAFDVRTGELVWNWDSGNPTQTEPIAPGDTYTPNSPNSWSISSVDEDLGMIYVPMANEPPDQWGGNRSEETDTYSSSVVALDLSTGQVRWVFQTVHHDLWDYDVPAQPSLIDLTVDGETIPALVQPTKQGELYVLNRRTGEPVLPVTEVPTPQGAAEGDFVTPTQPVSALSFDPEPLTGAHMWGATLVDQLLCRIEFQQLRYDGRYTPPTTQGTLVYPGNFGVFNWGSIAVDPERQIAFTTPTYLAFISQLVPREDDTSLYVQGDERPQGSLPALNENFGAPFAVKLSPFISPLGLPCQQPPWGYIAGADLTTGDVVWQHKNGTVVDSSPLPLPFPMGVPNLGGPMMTGSGIAFLSGTLDYYVRAYDVTTGEQLWENRLPAGGQATPMTYLGEDDRQYLVVVAGGHGSLGTKAGDDVIAYALPR